MRSTVADAMPATARECPYAVPLARAAHSAISNSHYPRIVYLGDGPMICSRNEIPELTSALYGNATSAQVSWSRGAGEGLLPNR
jgi:hypothetical protein